MKTQSATTSLAAKPFLPSMAVWHILLTRLLKQHYSLTLNDTETNILKAVSLSLMPLTFWLKSVNWFLSIAEDLVVKNKLHISRLLIS